MPEDFTPAYWETRYQRHPEHGRPSANRQLVTETTGLPPGTALEAGCGEGTDALWLAEHGWQVTAVDVSATALRRARFRDSADRVTWVEADLTTWTPPQEAFDLVTAHYVHPGSHQELLQRLTRAVAPGGTLLVVDHDDADHGAAVTTSPERLAALLDPARWQVVVAETRAGVHAGMTDVVLRARRTSLPRPAPGG